MWSSGLRMRLLGWIYAWPSRLGGEGSAGVGGGGAEGGSRVAGARLRGMSLGSLAPRAGEGETADADEAGCVIAVSNVCVCVFEGQNYWLGLESAERDIQGLGWIGPQVPPTSFTVASTREIVEKSI